MNSGSKVMTADAAITRIASDATLCTSGFVGTGTPDSLLAALARRFVTSGAPRDLTLVFAAGQGDGPRAAVSSTLGHSRESLGPGREPTPGNQSSPTPSATMLPVECAGSRMGSPVPT